MPGNAHALHLATIEYGFREFIVILITKGPKQGNCYIEEAVLNTVDWTSDVFANLKFITDDNLAEDLARYAEEQGVTDMKKIHELLVSTKRQSWIISNA